MIPQILTAIILYCNSQTYTQPRKCRIEMIDCVIGESILPKDLKLIQCIKNKDSK